MVFSLGIEAQKRRQWLSGCVQPADGLDFLPYWGAVWRESSVSPKFPLDPQVARCPHRHYWHYTEGNPAPP